MNIGLQIVLLVVGFVILIKGADFLIDGASATATRLKVSKMLIGLTIVAFGTGAPEFAVSVSSMLNGTSDLMLGNVVGSNIMNILLLVGIGAVIRPVRVKKDVLTKELPMLLLMSVMMAVVFFDNFSGAAENVISRTDGLVLMACFAIFLFYIIVTARKDRSRASKEAEQPKYKLPVALILVVLGLAGVVGGAELVVSSATEIATAFGVPERIIALTIVAFGTSLPELITTVKAARRNETELLVGNIIGSNIFNICIVLGLPAAIFGTVVPEQGDMLGLTVDMIMVLVSVVLLWVFAGTARKITRGEGWAMLGVFAVYYGFLVTTVVLKLTAGT